MAEDRHRLVQRYVERQRPYLPTYTNQDLVNERHRSPPQTDVGFGFDTPVLRPRAPTAPNNPRKVLSPSTRNKCQTVDTDSDRAARLADRRERKRKRRAIIHPRQKDDDKIVPATVPKKGRMKKPAALALLYGFSATNVTKDRLTLKPTPSLGVFNKGRASAKKKITTTRKFLSRNESFSESTFLNRPANPSRVDDDSDDSSTSDHREICVTRDRGKRIETSALKTSRAPIYRTTESEVWDIEMQSELPSSARDVSSESGAKESAPVVLDLHGAEWSASIDVTEERQTPRLPVTRNRSMGRCGSPVAGSDLRELCPPNAVDVSSLHPSHSASQVGCRVADADLRLVTSKYFTEPKPVSVQQESCVNSPQTFRSDDNIDVFDKDIKEGIYHVASPTNSLMCVPVPMVEFQTPYDMDPLDFSSDSWTHDDEAIHRMGPPMNSSMSVPVLKEEFQTRYDMDIPSDDYWEGEVAWDPLGGHDHVLEYDQRYPLVVDDGGCYPESIVEPYFFDGEAELEEEDDSEENVGYFLEGRALLRGQIDQGFSGLVQAELDVASRMRDHWLPRRL